MKFKQYFAKGGVTIELSTILTSSIVAGVVTTLVSFITQRRLKGYEVRIQYYKEEMIRLKKILDLMNKTYSISIIKDGKLSLSEGITANCERFSLAIVILHKNEEVFSEKEIDNLNELSEMAKELYMKLVKSHKEDEDNNQIELSDEDQVLMKKIMKVREDYYKEVEKLIKNKIRFYRKKIEKL